MHVSFYTKKPYGLRSLFFFLFLSFSFCFIVCLSFGVDRNRPSSSYNIHSVSYSFKKKNHVIFKHTTRTSCLDGSFCTLFTFCSSFSFLLNPSHTSVVCMEPFSHSNCAVYLTSNEQKRKIKG